MKVADAIMYNVFLGLTGITMLVAIPVLVVLRIVKAKKKESVKRIKLFLALSVMLLLASMCGALATVPEDMVAETPSTTKNATITSTTSEPTTEGKTTSSTLSEEKTTVSYGNAMVEQFKSLGFAQEEAEKVEKIFKTVGITKISNIQAVGNNGIDKLQAFKCDIFDLQRDKGGPSLLFTVEKRQLCHMSLNGFMNSNSLEYDSVVLYDIWNEDGTINTNAIGYKNVVDYENGKITKYEP